MYLNSRYSDGEVLPARKELDIVYVVRREFPPAQEFVLYRWKMGDRIDMVAAAVGIPRLRWWEIMDANPEIPSPTMIPYGSLIRIPKR